MLYSRHANVSEKSMRHPPELEEQASELRESLKARKQNAMDLGEEAGHRLRISQEARYLRQIEQKLSTAVNE